MRLKRGQLLGECSAGRPALTSCRVDLGHREQGDLNGLLEQQDPWRQFESKGSSHLSSIGKKTSTERAGSLPSES